MVDRRRGQMPITIPAARRRHVRVLHFSLQPASTAALFCIAWLGGNALAGGLPPDTIAQRVIACAACHGSEGRATNDGYYPRIAGKPAAYLYNQLRNFRDGRRRNAAMTYLVDHQSDTYLREIAGHFAAQRLPYPAPRAGTASAAVLARGRQLALDGDHSRRLAACAACHGVALNGREPAIPGLLGLPRDYLIAQLGAWRDRTRAADAPDCMAVIARRLSPSDIGAVTAWLATQSVPDGPAAAASPAVLPMACGASPGAIEK